jgi:hypothetical protein
MSKPTKADDDEGYCHADSAGFASCGNFKHANPGVGISGAEDLLIHILYNEYIGNYRHKSQHAVDDSRSHHHSRYCNAGVLYLR